MATPNNKPQEQAAAPQQDDQRQPQIRPCPKECSMCNFMQQTYCAAKLSFDAFGVMSAIMQKLDAQAAVIADLSDRLKAIEGTGAELAAPTPVQPELFPEDS